MCWSWRICRRIYRLFEDKLFLILLLFAWITITAGLFRAVFNFRSTYFQFGPSSTLLFISVPIDTWEKWLALTVYRIGARMMEIATIDVVEPWLTTHVQNEDRGQLPYEKWKCSVIVQLCFLYRSIEQICQFFYLGLQLDILLIESVGRMLVLQRWTIRRWLRNKTVPPRLRVNENEDEGYDLPGMDMPAEVRYPQKKRRQRKRRSAAISNGNSGVQYTAVLKSSSHSSGGGDLDSMMMPESNGRLSMKSLLELRQRTIDWPIVEASPADLASVRAQSV